MLMRSTLAQRQMQLELSRADLVCILQSLRQINVRECDIKWSQ
jgi:hypothetical protein